MRQGTLNRVAPVRWIAPPSGAKTIEQHNGVRTVIESPRECLHHDCLAHSTWRMGHNGWPRLIDACRDLFNHRPIDDFANGWKRGGVGKRSSSCPTSSAARTSTRPIRLLIGLARQLSRDRVGGGLTAAAWQACPSSLPSWRWCDGPTPGRRTPLNCPRLAQTIEETAKGGLPNATSIGDRFRLICDVF